MFPGHSEAPATALDVVRPPVARGALDALTHAPLRFLRSAWPWRALAYLASSAIPAGLVVAVVLLRLPALAVALVLIATPAISWYERLRTRLVETSPLPRRSRGTLRNRLRGTDLWREFAHAVVAVVALWWIDLGVVALSIIIPGTLLTAPWQPDGTGPVPAALLVLAGLLVIPVTAYPITAWAGARAAMSRAILGSQDELVRSRSRLMTAFELERRRIERDLHDGAQQRLVALSMRLGLARIALPPSSPALADLDEAQEQAKLALAELRELIRGVHPQILSGRGLAAAVRDAAGRSPVPVSVDLTVPRLAPDSEVQLYYVVAEALANLAKHSHATRGWVTGRVTKGVLRLEIGDNGVGGAAPSDGSGLQGLADRVSIVDGRLYLSSPPGGPTVLRIEVACSA